MNARKSAPGVDGFKSYLISGGASDNVETGMSVLFYFTFGAISSPPDRSADGDKCVFHCADTNVAFNIIRAQLPTSPVMD